MKTAVVIMCLLIGANICLAFRSADNESPDTTVVVLNDTLVEVVKKDSDYVKALRKMKCISGGAGAKSCFVPYAVTENGTTGGCSVSCTEGFYDCCGVRCVCVPY